MKLYPKGDTLEHRRSSAIILTVKNNAADAKVVSLFNPSWLLKKQEGVEIESMMYLISYEELLFKKLSGFDNPFDEICITNQTAPFIWEKQDYEGKEVWVPNAPSMRFIEKHESGCIYCWPIQFYALDFEPIWREMLTAHAVSVSFLMKHLNVIELEVPPHTHFDMHFFSYKKDVELVETDEITA